MQQFRTYPVWDLGVRWFHRINVICVLGLISAMFTGKKIMRPPLADRDTEV